MTIIFDENLSVGLVKGLREFGEDVHHITEYFPAGTPDEEWLKFIGENGWFLITRDKRIRRRPIEKEALKRYKIGTFFLGGKRIGGWDMIKQVVVMWQRIKELAITTSVPFAYIIPPRGSKIEKLALD